MAEDTLLASARARMVPRGPGCGVKMALDKHPELASQILELIEATPVVPYSIAEATLKDANIKIKADTLSRHRRGQCSCK